MTCQLSANIAMPTTTTETELETVLDSVGGERALGADHVVVEPRDQGAGLGAGEEGQRLALHVAEDPGAEVEDQALADAGGEPAARARRAGRRRAATRAIARASDGDQPVVAGEDAVVDDALDQQRVDDDQRAASNAVTARNTTMMPPVRSGEGQHPADRAPRDLRAGRPPRGRCACVARQAPSRWSATRVLLVSPRRLPELIRRASRPARGTGGPAPPAPGGAARRGRRGPPTAAAPWSRSPPPPSGRCRAATRSATVASSSSAGTAVVASPMASGLLGPDQPGGHADLQRPRVANRLDERLCSRQVGHQPERGLPHAEAARRRSAPAGRTPAPAGSRRRRRGPAPRRSTRSAGRAGT